MAAFDEATWRRLFVAMGYSPQRVATYAPKFATEDMAFSTADVVMIDKEVRPLGTATKPRRARRAGALRITP